MPYNNIPYKSFCWSLGTTSYRTKNFNLNIERQLSLLSEFWGMPENLNEEWAGNNLLQTKYYDFIKSKDFVTGDAPNKPKDAREKTSGLVNIGLIFANRRLTEVGEALLKINKDQNYTSDNILQISKDSLIYLKQLLKTTIEINGATVRPFVVFLFLLSQVQYLTLEEYAYLLPLCIDKETTDNMVEVIQHVRNGTKSIDEIILAVLMRMDNYQSALTLLLGNNVTEELICTVGFNRKSRNYDKPYYPLYLALKEVCLNNNNDYIVEVNKRIRNINGKPEILWRSLLFDTPSARAISNNPVEHFKATALSCARNEEEFKKVFFETMHLFKAKATLSDYLDLNRRYIKNSDVVLFEDSLVKLDIVPKQYFNAGINRFYENAFNESDKLFDNCDLVDISPSLAVDKETILSGIGSELGIEITTMEHAHQILEQDRYRRLHVLIDNQFTDDKLLELLELLERRDDAEINRLITDNADIPTIFEYILGIIWYKASEKHGKILDFMKLSLDADLLPKTHAGGGVSDIIYKYEANDIYPAHDVLLEATLINTSNQRNMEMEPVSRHLGRHLLMTNNLNSYCVFVANSLNINVISDFRGRRTMQYFDTSDTTKSIDGMKIIPIDISALKCIVENSVTYSNLYSIFEDAYNSEEAIPDWYSTCIGARI